jgi:glycosyltransferase involved in cell wall biosynthesis/peptidoglycan/xylan/chitin deacetylase (PgdA/CDA1 family)
MIKPSPFATARESAPRLARADGSAPSSLSRKIFSMMSPAGPAARLSIMLFHKVPQQADPLVPGDLTLDRFERLLDFATANTNVLPLSEAVSALQRGTLPSRAVVLTFDDGYAEWVENVAPALRRRNLPATFFVTTGQLQGEALWHERIAAAVRALPDEGVVLPYGFGNYGKLDTLDSRVHLLDKLQERLKYTSLSERMDAIAQLEAQACRPLILPRRFDTAAVRALHSQGFEIGAHTVDHPILNECSAQQARDEIGGCKDALEAIVKGRVDSFAYPNGRPGTDFGARHVDIVKACGYKAAVTTSSGAASRRSDPFQLPRFSPWGRSDNQITFQLTRNMLSGGRALPASSAAEDQTDVRCLMIASTFPPIHGGSAVVYDSLCQHMPAGSIRVLTANTSYVNGQEIEGWREHDAAVDYPVERIPLLRPRMLPAPANSLVSAARLLFMDVPLYAKAFLRAASLIRKHRINVVCVGELVAGSMLGIALKKLFDVKLVVYVHGEEITTASSGRLYGNKRKEYLQAFDKVVAVSSFTCDALTELMDVPPDAISLIPNGVDVDRFTPGERDAALIARHGLAGKKTVLTVGRLVRRKGIDMTLQAMARIVARRQDVHYLIVGDGELREELTRTIAELGLGAHVTLVGKVSDDELLRYLRTCDLFVMPNRTLADGDTEGFGLVFREANACHKPVIGGRAGGAVEAVADGVSGLLVDGYQPDQIAAAIERILDDPALAQRLSDGGLKLARENSTAAVARRFLRTCERLLGAGAR